MDLHKLPQLLQELATNPADADKIREKVAEEAAVLVNRVEFLEDTILLLLRRLKISIQDLGMACNDEMAVKGRFRRKKTP